jgi:predicted transcriptional regulator
LPALIQSVHEALTGIGQPEAEPGPGERKLSVAQIRKSITPDALISFIDGRPYRMLKRHLATHGLTVAEYKARFGLPSDYPTTAPSYSAARSTLAKEAGLGQKGGVGKGRKAG